MPPTPRARSRQSAPVGITCTSREAATSPKRMIEPFPWLLSICWMAVLSAFSFSTVPPAAGAPSPVRSAVSLFLLTGTVNLLHPRATPTDTCGRPRPSRDADTAYEHPFETSRGDAHPGQGQGEGLDHRPVPVLPAIPVEHYNAAATTVIRVHPDVGEPDRLLGPVRLRARDPRDRERQVRPQAAAHPLRHGPRHLGADRAVAGQELGRHPQ